MRIKREDSLLVAVDYQEKILPAVLNREELMKKSLRLIRGMKALGVPMLVSEQYPKGLGKTVGEVAELVGEEFNPVEKMTFSCAGEEEFMKRLAATGRKTVIICGIEAHVCVLQTVIDLMGEGYTVVMVKDCVSSRFAEDLEVGLKRAELEGAIITTSESLLFELTEVAGSDVFKTISKLVK
jgi:hypothetical protein